MPPAKRQPDGRSAAAVSAPRSSGQMRQPRLADLVASALRERIVDGTLTGDDSLPGLEKLVQEFGVSPPSVREALRILENEGLITVRRGNVGGAVVHRPTPDSAAYMLGLVLQTEHVPVADLAAALGHLEALCARLCATRGDRRRHVVPKLRQLQRASEACVEDAVAFERACQGFHDALVANCGSHTIMLTVGALERLWREQQEGWAHRVAELHEYPDVDLRRSGLESHAAILRAIESGDPVEAERVTTDHLRTPRIRSVDSEAHVRATDLARRGPRPAQPR